MNLLNNNTLGGLGFTATRRGLTRKQKFAGHDLLLKLYKKYDHKGHHGDAVGGDRDFHKIMRTIGGIFIIGHIPDNSKDRAFCDFDEVRRPRPYLVRNKCIVVESDILIGAPAENEMQLRSGTWSTIRYARKLVKPIYIIFPDGSIKEENL